MKNPLIVLASVVACSITIPILISIVSYDGIEAKPLDQKNNVINETVKKVINYQTVDKKSPIINVYNHKLGKYSANGY